jgi:hypothetical protein
MWAYPCNGSTVGVWLGPFGQLGASCGMGPVSILRGYGATVGDVCWMARGLLPYIKGKHFYIASDSGSGALLCILVLIFWS